MSSKNTKLGFSYYPVESTLKSLEDLAKDAGIDFDILHSCVVLDFLIMISTAMNNAPGDGAARIGAAMSSFFSHYSKSFDEFNKLVKERRNEES